MLETPDGPGKRFKIETKYKQDLIRRQEEEANTWWQRNNITLTFNDILHCYVYAVFPLRELSPFTNYMQEKDILISVYNGDLERARKLLFVLL